MYANRCECPTGDQPMSVRKRVWRTPKTNELREAWIVDYTDRAGKQHIKTFERKRDAEAYEVVVRGDISRGVHSSARVTVATAGKQWLADAESRLERSTFDSYRQHLADHIVPFLGTVKLTDVTVPLVRTFADRLRAEGRSPAMVKRVIGDLGALLADAQERGLIAQNVVRALPRKKQRAAAQRAKGKLKVGEDIPTPAEIRTFIAHLQDPWRPLFLTAIFTGLRASELRGLRWSDVDLKHRELHVRQRADRYNAIGEPKTEAGTRKLPLPPTVVNTLREWKLVCPKGELDLVFPNGAGNIEGHSNIVHRGLAPILVAAGVVGKNGEAKYTGLHAFRHFYASWCINRCADGGLELPLKVVQARLGHSSIQVTADRYGHLFPSADSGHELAAAEKALLS
jgi:integrase